ncbi:MAG: hypothetical protein H8E10_15150 [Desulfobacterales bacterium]|nr:hypothetical protein [Desulfobacterales bacterium]
MKSLLARFAILAGMLLGLPLAGIVLKSLPLRQYLEFPPQTRYVIHAPFSWPVFAGYFILILVAVGPLVIRGIRPGRIKALPASMLPFPWWGWLGIAAGLIFWMFAWTRFPWFEIFQPHTFTPLWLSYIVVINAMTYRRRGRCMMLDRPGFFLALFPLSALFWWFFEYLNRFVQNWYYMGVHYSPAEYFWYATLSFSTVLPAVLGTREWVAGSSWLEQGFKNFLRIRVPCPKVFASALLFVSGAGLAGIGVWPDLLFPLLWMSPFLIIVSLQIMWREDNLLEEMVKGDWRPFIASASAALMCGWFWEMWNYYSMAKWEYAVPFVQKYLVFEMPVLGFAGYLPFGLECAVIGGAAERFFRGPNAECGTLWN